MKRINKKIIDGNLLISEFMGEKVCYNFQKSELPMHQFKLEGIKPTAYHERWDWLMPVAKKCIESYDDMRGDIFKALEKCDMDALYKACVKFIEWYNKHIDK